MKSRRPEAHRSQSRRTWSLRLTTAGAALGLAAVIGAGPAVAAEPTPADILRAGAQKGVADGYPGVIGLVRKGDTTQYVHAGVGSLATKVPADPKARFRIGSNTKAFTATVLLQLESEHRLSLDDTVARWLPGAVGANGYDGSKITLRQLLNHTSGLPEYAGSVDVSVPYVLNTDPRRPWPPQTLVNIALKQHKPNSAPGQKFGYSNTNYVLAGMVIKAVTGNDAATEIKQRIIEPLGLRDTTFPTSDPALYGTYLRGYMYPLVGVLIRDVTASNVQVFGPAGAMVSTQDDLAAFGRALLTGRLLPPAQMAELKTTVPMNAEGTAAYGLGIEHLKLPCGQWAWGHNGAVLGYFSEWLTSEDGSRQVVHANNEYHMIAGTPGQLHTGEAATKAYCALS
ncbi:D-stereospecific peptide hydrolase precursor [Streptomyces sp. NBRC 110611]|uniref:serine hydrolase domain-containing protein n=1 Tax=Streptomyces sp. NBRC 110611 TaxID=1621259 RepID=UPI00082BF7A1|nr:serine hydrolase domain-containing protein [Streptomyces sp. NBRC 110611]GAU70860.1 D-stereospecific peptide hydrolase precursor [Streptomyces sp. NBRC 110611]